RGSRGSSRSAVCSALVVCGRTFSFPPDLVPSARGSPDMMRLLICSSFFGLLGCSSKSFDREQALTNLLAHTDKIRTAILQDDHTRVAELTHPNLVKALGGNETFVRRMEKLTAEMQDKGFAWQGIDFSEPSDLLEASGDLYTIVPYTMRLAGPGGA